MTDKIRMTLTEAEALIRTAFIKAGLGEAQAGSVARALVAAEAEGQGGHGFSRLEDYLAQLRSGKVNRQAQITVSQPKPSLVLVDADYGFAYPALDQAIERGAAVAKAQGMAAIAVRHSHHCGALSLQVERLADQGLVALMFANTPKAIAPWGGNSALFGTNPIAFAAPRDVQSPLVIDLSLSKVARGKVSAAKKNGQAIPEGWALDSQGQPTTDPDAALAGTMLPIGDAKGTSLALMVEILAAVVVGSALSSEASSFFLADGPAPNVGQFILALDASALSADFAPRLEGLLGLIETQEGARLPGSRRLVSRKVAKEQGLMVAKVYLDAARAAASGAYLLVVRRCDRSAV